MPSSDSDSKREKGSKKPRSLFPLAVFFLVLLLVASGVLVFLVREHLEAAAGMEQSSYEMMSSGFSCEYSEAQKLYPFADGLMKITNNRVAYISMNGTEIYGYDIDMDTPFCVVNEKYALVADYGGFFCALYDINGVVYQHQMQGKISFATIADNGNSAFILEHIDTKGSVYLLDRAANFISEWRSVESGYPLSLSFSSDSSIVHISLADTDGSIVKPYLKQLEIYLDDGIYVAKDLSIYSPASTEFLPSIVPIGKNEAFLAGISNVYYFSGADTMVGTKPYGQIFSVIASDQRLAVLYSEGVGQEVNLEIIGKDLVRTKPIRIGSAIVDAKSYNGRIVIAADDKLVVISSNQVEKTIEVNKEILRIGFKSDGSLVVVMADGVREISL